MGGVLSLSLSIELRVARVLSQELEGEVKRKRVNVRGSVRECRRERQKSVCERERAGVRRV